MSLKVLSRDDVFTKSPAWREPGITNYLTMYSSVFGGVVTDPALMVIPLDDRVINRSTKTVFIRHTHPFTDAGQDPAINNLPAASPRCKGDAPDHRSLSRKTCCRESST